MPFIPYTGVNHHQQSILFGCDLLWNETEENFFWLLSTWLKVMSGVPPKNYYHRPPLISSYYVKKKNIFFIILIGIPYQIRKKES